MKQDNFSHTDYLNSIVNLRLLCNTRAEYSKLLCVDLTNNNLGKRSEEDNGILCGYLTKRYQNLESYMEYYQAVSGAMNTLSTMCRRVTERQLADFIYYWYGYEVEGITTSFAKAFEEHCTLLSSHEKPEKSLIFFVLITLKLLPPYSARSKRGNVVDIEHAQQQLTNFAKRIVEPLSEVDYKMLLQPIERKYSGKVNSRYALIEYGEQLLDAIAISLNVDCANKYRQQQVDNAVMLDIIGHLWSKYKPDSDDDSVVNLWEMIQVGKDYELLCYRVHKKSRKIECIYYNLELTEDSEGVIHFLITKARNLSQCYDAQNYYFDSPTIYQGILEVDDRDRVYEINFRYNIGENPDTAYMPHRIISTALTHEQFGEFYRGWSIESVIERPKNLSHNRVITSTHIYIEHSADDCGMVKSWIRIPHHSLGIDVYQYNLASLTIAHASQYGREFLEFPTLRIALDISNEQICRHFGVEVVESIEVESERVDNEDYSVYL